MPTGCTSKAATAAASSDRRVRRVAVRRESPGRGLDLFACGPGPAGPTLGTEAAGLAQGGEIPVRLTRFCRLFLRLLRGDRLLAVGFALLFRVAQSHAVRDQQGRDRDAQQRRSRRPVPRSAARAWPSATASPPARPAEPESAGGRGTAAGRRPARPRTGSASSGPSADISDRSSRGPRAPAAAACARATGSRCRTSSSVS